MKISSYHFLASARIISMEAKTIWLCFFIVALAFAQDDDEVEGDPTAEQLCKNRPADEYFRLSTEGDCRDVVRCDKNSDSGGVTRLASVRCPVGLAFDIDRQTCDWKTHVKNCDKLEKPQLVLPHFKTEEPFCSDGKLACGDDECIDKELFCNGKLDCKDGSDENACKPQLVLPHFKTEEPFCSDGKLACGDDECIDKELFCNGKLDCKDGSDENACKPQLVLPHFKTEEPFCSDGKLACGDDECIDKELFCNGKLDCKDGSDENACTVDSDPNRAPDCDQSQCVLPDCFCSADGTRIPGGLEPTNVPQMITITFNGAVNVDNIDLYEEIFNGQRTNPNGCQIKGTFFVSHKYTNYSAVQDLYRKGHEISVFSLTAKDDPNYWTHGSYDDWLAEMAGARLIVERFANISDGNIIGVRAPFLRVGGNKQFEMMTDQFFFYDASITASLGRVPIWPYTLYFRMPHKCNGNAHNCPSRSHPVWEMVMNELDRRDDPTFDESLPGCHMVDSCSNIQSGEQFARLLRHNVMRHMNSNRAPLGLHFHASWLKSKKELKEELIKFIEEMLAQNNVYFVTNFQVIQWMQNPTEINGLRDFTDWKEKCDVKSQPYCSLPNSCPLHTRELPGETLRLFTCMKCPNNYPWILDPTGDGFSVKK